MLIVYANCLKRISLDRREHLSDFDKWKLEKDRAKIVKSCKTFKKTGTNKLITCRNTVRCQITVSLVAENLDLYFIFCFSAIARCTFRR